MNNRQLVVFDLDGTLLTSEKVITEHAKKEIVRLQERGHLVTLATGRTILSAQQYIDELYLETPIILYDGSIIYDPMSKQVIQESYIPTDQYIELLTVFDTMSSTPFVYTVDNYNKLNLYYTNETSNVTEYLKTLNESSIGCEIISVESLYELQDTNIAQLFLAETSKNATLIEELKNQFHELTIANFENNLMRKLHYLEIYNRLSNKGHALTYLKEEVLVDKIVCFGDNSNDYEMFTVATTAVAMGNSITEIKENADYVTLSNDEDGVAYFLKNIFKS